MTTKPNTSLTGDSATLTISQAARAGAVANSTSGSQITGATRRPATPDSTSKRRNGCRRISRACERYEPLERVPACAR